MFCFSVWSVHGIRISLNTFFEIKWEECNFGYCCLHVGCCTVLLVRLALCSMKWQRCKVPFWALGILPPHFSHKPLVYAQSSLCVGRSFWRESPQNWNLFERCGFHFMSVPLSHIELARTSLPPLFLLSQQCLATAWSKWPLWLSAWYLMPSYLYASQGHFVRATKLGRRTSPDELKQYSLVFVTWIFF